MFLLFTYLEKYHLLDYINRLIKVEYDSEIVRLLIYLLGHKNFEHLLKFPFQFLSEILELLIEILIIIYFSYIHK